MDHIQLLKDLFEYSKSFDFNLYKEFLGELCKTYDRSQQLIPILKSEESHVVRKQTIGKFTDSQGKKIDFLIIEMRKGEFVQKARLLQRNIVSSYLKEYGVYAGVDHAIAVFYAGGFSDRRLSFVKQQFKLDIERKVVINDYTPAKRYSFLIEKGSGNQTIRKQTLSLLKSINKPNINEIEKIFSVEKVTEEFFDKYKLLYAKLKDAFQKDSTFSSIQKKYNQGDSHFTENFVKKLLGQIVFLYFLQKKGRLGIPKEKKRGDGDKSFLRTLYTKCHAENRLFFNDYLEPLFYNTLNKERPGHWSEYFNCKIPYLNGGLFQPFNDYARDGSENTIYVNNNIFEEILDVFETFNFTIYENDPLEQDVAVDPEMLGKIFENLLPDNERKGKGAFYTPREVVHYMCKQALLQYLVTETGIVEERIAALIRRKDSMDNLKKLDEFTIGDEEKNTLRTEGLAIDNALKEVKIIDPAVGSGAFPMGILKEIVDLRRYIKWNILQDKLIPTNELIYVLKKETLSNCIYGVDLDPGAVEIAKLRFWLSLVVDYEGDHIEPLPNLDYKIMQGNSLIDNPIVGNHIIDLGLETKNRKLTKYEKDNIMKNGLFGEESSVLLKRLTILHNDYFKETAPEYKTRIKKEIHDLETRIIIQKAEETINNIKSDIENNQNLPTSDKQVKDILQKNQTVNQIKEMISKLNEYGVKNYFPRKLHFGEIFRDHGGFDIVIGNPPYLRVQGIRNIDSSFVDYLTLNYKSATGSFDLYAIFLEKSLSMINANGIIEFIMPTKRTNAAFGSGLREILSNGNYQNKIVSFEAYQVFNASTYTGIQQFRKSSPHLSYLQLDQDLPTNDALGNWIDNIKETDFNEISNNNLSIDPWVLTDKVTGLILEKMKQQKYRVKNLFEKIFQGIATSKDSIYFLYECKEIYPNLIEGFSKELNRRITIEKSILGKLLKGDQVHRYESLVSDNYVIIPYKRDSDFSLYTEQEISSIFPHLYSYFKEVEEALRMREKGKLKDDNYWFRYIYPKNLHLFPKTKLFCPDISLGGNFVLDEKGEFYSTTTLYGYIKKNGVTLEDKYLMAILNSSICRFFLRNTGTVLSHGYFRYKPDYINPFPIPDVDKDVQSKIISIVDKIIDQKNKDYRANTSLLEDQIDQIVYQLYNLNPEEIVIIKKNIGK